MISISRSVGSCRVFVGGLVGFLALVLTGCSSGGGGTCSGASCAVTTYTISVASTNPATGVQIGYGNAVNNLAQSGNTSFTVSASSGSIYYFSAPATAGGNNFSGWTGCTATMGTNCTVSATGSSTITANYVTAVAPTVTVTPSAASITTAQTVSVTVAVAAPSGGTGTPTGTVVLTSGSYTSGSVALTNGSATISIAAGALATGTDSLNAAYTPDTAGAVGFLSASGTGTVTVTTAAPTITVSPGTANVTVGQSQTFTATAMGLSSSAVTWSVAVASGGSSNTSAGTINSAGVYQSPFPAPTTVTVTATSTANSSITGTATVTLVAPTSTAGPALAVDAGTVTRAINPLIYGANAYLLDAASAQAMGITVARWGGDATSRYNYQNADSNSGEDYYFLNGGTYAMLTTNANSTTSEANFNDFIAETTALGIASLGTAPVQGYVSNSNFSACSFPKATYPNQQSFDPSGTCGNGVETNGTDLFGDSSATPPTWSLTSLQEPPPTAPGAGNNSSSWATGTWTGSWVNCLLTGSGPNSTSCASAAGKDATIWDLDNEPAWWDGVHRDVHPSPSTYDEVTNGGIGTALAIKAVDANAQVSGPVIDYWWNYFYSKKDIESGWAAVNSCGQPWSNPVDREAHGGVPMMVYYLQQMAAASNTYGVRLLDFLTIHSYSSATYNGASVGLAPAGDTAEQQARMNSTRALWDPTYTDPNFVQPNYSTDANYIAPPNCSAAEAAVQSPQIIPMMQGWVSSGWTGTTYPAPKLSIDEYNFGGTESINGAVTQADVLGIFGKYGLDMGVFWPTSGYAGQVPGNMAFAIYRNYDANKSTFGDNELSSTTADQSKLAVYAASRTADGAVTVVVINKTYGPLTDTLSINNLTSTATTAQVYQYSNANLSAIVAQPAATITAPASGSTASTISAASSQPLTFPGQSITLFVIPSH